MGVTGKGNQTNDESFVRFYIRTVIIEPAKDPVFWVIFSCLLIFYAIIKG
jgi:hypothetical protein